MKFSGNYDSGCTFSPKSSEDQKEKGYLSPISGEDQKQKVSTAIWHYIRPELVGFIRTNRHFFV